MPRIEPSLKAEVSVPANVHPAFRPIADAVCALLNYTIGVAFDRIRMNNSKRWQKADDRTNGAFRYFIDLMGMSCDTGMQCRFVAQNVYRLEEACDLKLWKTFCGRSHAVPKEMIDALRAEIVKIKPAS